MRKEDIEKERIAREIERDSICQDLPEAITVIPDFQSTLNRYLNSAGDAVSCQFGEDYITFRFFTHSTNFRGDKKDEIVTKTYRVTQDGKGAIIVFQKSGTITYWNTYTSVVNTRAFYVPNDIEEEQVAIALRIADANLMGVFEVLGGSIKKRMLGKEQKLELNSLGAKTYKNLLPEKIAEVDNYDVDFESIREIVREESSLNMKIAMDLLDECESAINSLKTGKALTLKAFSESK